MSGVFERMPSFSRAKTKFCGHISFLERTYGSPEKSLFPMKLSRISKCLLRLCSVALVALPVSAQNSEKPVSTPNEDKGQWPRSFETSSGYEVAIHEPQVHEWPEYQKITMRAAVAVKPNHS